MAEINLHMADKKPQLNGALKVPLRMCVICRRRFEKTLLTRHALGENGALAPDERKAAPGRGWYCCADPRCMEKMARFNPAKKRVSRKKAAAR